jgi:uncharacterized protein
VGKGAGMDVAIVTGASSGFGEAIARRLAAGGYRVALAARSAERLDAIAREIGERALAVPTDVSIRSEREALVDKVVGEWGRIDVLVNNAGYGKYASATEMAPDDVEDMFAVNVLGMIDLTRLVLPAMVDRGSGHVVNMGSIAGHVAAPPLTVYASTKHAVVGFTRALHRELRGTGVHATVVSPGWARTRFGQVASGKDVDPSRVPGGVGADRVARAVTAVLRRPRREVVVPAWLWAGVVSEHVVPWPVDAFVAGLARRWRRGVEG